MKRTHLSDADLLKEFGNQSYFVSEENEPEWQLELHRAEILDRMKNPQIWFRFNDPDHQPPRIEPPNSVAFLWQDNKYQTPHVLWFTGYDETWKRDKYNSNSLGSTTSDALEHGYWCPIPILSKEIER